MMKNTLILALIATLPAIAQDNIQKPEFPQQAPHWGAEGRMPERKARPDMHRHMLEKFDANKDGKLDEAEMAGMKPKREKGNAERPEGPRGPRGKRGEREERGERGKGFPRPEGMEHPGNRRRPEQRGPKGGKRGERPMPPAGAPVPFEG